MRSKSPETMLKQTLKGNEKLEQIQLKTTYATFQ